MKYLLNILFLLSVSLTISAQTAPPHLKYFGYAIVDCGFDDPLDGDTIVNYISEVDSFSNLAHLCVYNYNDNIINRVNLMNNHCVLPVIHMQTVFFEVADTLAPSGENYDLISNFSARWNTFKTINLTVLDSAKVGAFYIADEPFWNGITFQDLDTVCSLIKSDFPNIPILIIEAYPALSVLQVPTTIDWIGFDEYGIFDPSTDVSYLNNLALLKSKRSNPGQKIFLIVDDQWLPYYGSAGYPPDTIRFMVQNYYNLAASDTAIMGLFAYLWPGGLDDPQQLGVRDMPQSVIDKNIEIGQMIKANFSPCSANGISSLNKSNQQVIVFPNPANTVIHFSFKNIQPQPVELRIYNFQGRVVLKKEAFPLNLFQIDIRNFQQGVYFYEVKSKRDRIGKGVFIKI